MRPLTLDEIRLIEKWVKEGRVKKIEGICFNVPAPPPDSMPEQIEELPWEVRGQQVIDNIGKRLEQKVVKAACLKETGIELSKPKLTVDKDGKASRDFQKGEAAYRLQSPRCHCTLMPVEKKKCRSCEFFNQKVFGPPKDEAGKCFKEFNELGGAVRWFKADRSCYFEMDRDTPDDMKLK